jgi:hypothetical protein
MGDAEVDDLRVYPREAPLVACFGCIAEKSGFDCSSCSARGCVANEGNEPLTLRPDGVRRVVFGNVNQVLVRLWARAIEVGGLPPMGIPLSGCMSDRVCSARAGPPSSRRRVFRGVCEGPAGPVSWGERRIAKSVGLSWRYRAAGSSCVCPWGKPWGC